MFFIHQGWNEVRITPNVTDKQAREWADKWLDTEDYIKLFGEPAEQKVKEQLGLLFFVFDIKKQVAAKLTTCFNFIYIPKS